MEYNKLVRDHIPEVIAANGGRAVTRILEGDEYLAQLHRKLQEEVGEYLESGEMEELCDVAEVIAAIAAAKGVSSEALISLREEKAKRNGRFERRILLIRTE